MFVNSVADFFIDLTKAKNDSLRKFLWFYNFFPGLGVNQKSFYFYVYFSHFNAGLTAVSLMIL
jgi:hypothetical protein